MAEIQGDVALGDVYVVSVSLDRAERLIHVARDEVQAEVVGAKYCRAVRRDGPWEGAVEVYERAGRRAVISGGPSSRSRDAKTAYDPKTCGKAGQSD